MATGRGALAIDSVRQRVRRDRLGKMAGKATEQRSGQAGCVGSEAEEGKGRLRRQRSRGGAWHRNFLPRAKGQSQVDSFYGA